MTQPYAIDTSSNSKRRAVEDWLWGLDLVSAPLREKIVTAWVSTWASSPYERLEDMPFSADHAFMAVGKKPSYQVHVG